MTDKKPIRSKDNVWMNPRFSLSIKEEDGDLAERFKQAKERSRQRLERKELTHAEFLELLLNVWEEYEEPRVIGS
jgi:hypothetical protein